MEFTVSETNLTSKWRKLADPNRYDAPIWRFFIKPPNRVEIRLSKVVPDDDDACDPILVVEPDHVTTIILFRNEELYIRNLIPEGEQINA